MTAEENRLAMHRGIVFTNNEFDLGVESLVRAVFDQGFAQGKRKMAEAAGVNWPVEIGVDAVYADWRGYGPGSLLPGGSAYRKTIELAEQARWAVSEAPLIDAGGWYQPPAEESNG